MAAAVPTLVGLARRPASDELARHAQLALGEIATPAAIATLVEVLRRPPVPDETKVALLTAGAPAVEPLAAEVAHGPPSSAALAALLLGQLGDRRATATLAAAADARDGDPALWLVAARCAGAPQGPGFPPRAPARGRGPRGRRAPRGLRGAAGARRSARRRRARRRASPIRTRVSGRRGAPARGCARSEAAPRCASRAGARAGATPHTRPSGRRRRGDGPLRRIPSHRAAPARLDDALANVDSGEPAPAAPSVRSGRRRTPEAPLENRAVVERLLAVVAAGGPAAAAAADVLGRRASLRGAERRAGPGLRRAPPPVRARLCAAIARAPHGGEWLAAVLAADDDRAEVRAAAAWAARGVAGARARAGDRGAWARRTAGPQRARGARRRRAARAADGRPSASRPPTEHRSSDAGSPWPPPASRSTPDRRDRRRAPGAASPARRPSGAPPGLSLRAGP